MPWQSGGSGGGGPWGGGGSGNTGGPWGGGTGGSGGGGGGGGGFGGQRPPDLEDMIRRSQEKLKGVVPGGFGGGRGVLIAIAIILVLWLASGFYRVQPDQQGVVLRFGAWVQTTEPGLNWHLPYPIETVLTPSVEAINSIDVGYRSGSGASRTTQDVPEESLMLTGDQNIIDIDFAVFWKIADAGQFLFNIRDPEATVKTAAEAAMREIIGRTDIQRALTESRQNIELDTRELLQSLLVEYEAGIEITQVQLQQVQPPAQVIDAFNDVQRSLQDRDRLRNEAEAYRNDILPRARGEAQQIIQDANAYRERIINEAIGEAQRFVSVYEAYQQDPEIATRRMYLETMQEVMSGTNKVILGNGTEGIVPYLPLNELQRRMPTAPQSSDGQSR
ncbi:FtsH protease activity modulator HflK [Aquibaculum arenosum]|uniref:Protein HflK n=1 Tax=Aquibaculum arenosum TaxID=3032591 RepID=A0ABT5YMB4_9PROT|nr:FtsH protease activity modulator HflK [Fodinicurvata sp. CAU 1616]MDF2096106.1 FtsH protease activity modulator HflK [Fodinicurvata sp. CAU 1616]